MKSFPTSRLRMLASALAVMVASTTTTAGQSVELGVGAVNYDAGRDRSYFQTRATYWMQRSGGIQVGLGGSWSRIGASTDYSVRPYRLAGNSEQLLRMFAVVSAAWSQPLHGSGIPILRGISPSVHLTGGVVHSLDRPTSPGSHTGPGLGGGLALTAPIAPVLDIRVASTVWSDRLFGSWLFNQDTWLSLVLRI